MPSSMSLSEVSAMVASADNPLKLMSKLEDIVELKPTKEHDGMVYFYVGAQM